MSATTNEIGEKIYYGDETAKVTNVRVTCSHITVPVEKIESVDVNFRIEAFSFSVIIFLSSLLLLLFTGPIPPIYDAAYLFFTIILIVSSFMWIIMVVKNYVELIVNVGGRRLVILSVNMWKKIYLCKIAAAIGDAISDEKKYQKMRKSGEINTETPALNQSETVRLKLMLEDYEKLTAKK